MFEEPRELSVIFHIDTNRINSRRRLENMNKLEHWAEHGLIRLETSQVAHEEAMAGGDQRRARKALEMIFSETMPDTADEQRQLAAIEAILFPSGAKTQNERNDVEIAFNAAKYQRVLVTADGDLLAHRRDLGSLGIRVVTDREAVALVEQRIAERDERARRLSALTGVACPDWVGKDSLATLPNEGMHPSAQEPGGG
jgi:hypothetical protein